ncbi:hypothetical protein GPJ56_001601 [Histomonas meleagridis]|uniref:uncharacterized protein n=1 Tax=Histomonas meleagridis TaxID=135588 RepID=UPI00355A1A81|nr:hypothetical protein GPJ56_001601 [Histomonas meleagridis]KAH0807107.1 hypothetical protein GO595_000283 [Histomonas meleagridis]
MLNFPRFNTYPYFDSAMRKVDDDRNDIGKALKVLGKTLMGQKTLTDPSHITSALSSHRKFCNFMNSFFDGLKRIWPKLEAGIPCFEEFQAYMKDIEHLYDYTWRGYADSYVKPSKDGWGVAYLFDEDGQKFMKDYGFYNDWKADYDIISKDEFVFITQCDVIDIHLKRLYDQFSSNVRPSEIDPFLEVCTLFPYLEDRFEAVFTEIADKICKFEIVYNANEYANETGHKWREILPPCDEDDENSGNYIIRQSFPSYESDIYFFQVTDMYCDLGLKLQQFWDIGYRAIHRPGSKPIPLLLDFSFYYQQKLDAISNFLDKILDITLKLIYKAYPHYISESEANNTYNRLLWICEEFQPPKHRELIKSKKLWFEDVYKKVLERKANTIVEVITDVIDEKLDKIEKSVKKHKKELENARKQQDIKLFKTSRRNLKKDMKGLDDMDITGNRQKLIDEISEIIQQTHKEKKYIEIQDFMKVNAQNVKRAMSDLEAAVATNNSNLSAAYRVGLKSALEAFNDQVNRFTGDIDELKRNPEFVKLMNDANQLMNSNGPPATAPTTPITPTVPTSPAALYNAAPTAPPAAPPTPPAAPAVSPEVVNAETRTVPNLNAMFPSIEMMTNMAPNPMMIPSITMMKTQVLTAYNELKPLENQSNVIKVACIGAEAAMKKIDDYIAKSASTPQ